MPQAYAPARFHALLTPGEVIRMLRELKGWTQAELADRSGITTTNLSLHPAIIIFPEHEGREFEKVA
jgi:hypothetical protein